MNRTVPRLAATRGPLIALTLALALALALSGCAQNRSAATQSWSGVAVDGGNLYVGTNEGQLMQLSAEGGIARIAPYSVPEAQESGGFTALYGTPTVGNGRVFAGAYNGVVVSLEAENLTNPRTFEIDGNPLAKGIAGAVVPASDAVVIAAAEDANEGRLYVLEQDSLIERCRYPARNEPPVGQMWTAPVVQGGVAYFGDLGQRVHAVDLLTCRPVWEQPAQLGGAVVATPLIERGNLYVGAFDQSFYAIDLYTGATTRLFEAENWFWASAVSDGARIYAPNLDGRIYAYDLSAERVAWTYPAEPGDPILSTPALVGGQLVYASDSGVMTVLSASSGARQWDRRVGDTVRAPVTTDGTRVYVHALDESVSAVDMETKQLVWERNLKDVR